MKQSALVRFNLIILAFFLVFAGMYFARTFLIPVALSLLFAMLLTPICRWLERKGVTKGLAAALCAMMLLIVLGGILTFVALQIRDFSNEAPELKEKASSHYQKIKVFLEEKVGISIEDGIENKQQTQNTSGNQTSKQQSAPQASQYNNETSNQNNAPQSSSKEQDAQVQIGQEQQGEDTKGAINIGGEGGPTIESAFTYLFKILAMLFGSVLTIGLILAYLVLFLYYRRRFKKSIILAFPPEDREKTKQILHESGKVAQQYLGGMFIVTTILAVLNSTGLLLIGVDHAILFGVVAGYLNFIPFIGSLLGSTLPIAMTLLTQNSITPALAIAGFFMLSQFLEETVLTPKFVGNQVSVNPLVIIFAIMIGNAVWGIAGIVIFIPLVAIVKIIFDHIEPLKPIGYALGQDQDEEDDGPSFFVRISDWLKKKINKK